MNEYSEIEREKANLINPTKALQGR